MAAQKRILLEDWQEIKPYNKTAKSDLYFLGISNEINDKIYEKEFHLPLQNFIREEGISLFCMFLTSYLEDIISGSEVWNSFIKKHKELYGKPLPFYETDKNYVEGEVNIQDVKFLVWYFPWCHRAFGCFPWFGFGHPPHHFLGWEFCAGSLRKRL